MKSIIWIALLAVVSTVAAEEPAKASDRAVEAVRRQDLTGDGSFHRQGLLREQRAALAKRKKVKRVTVESGGDCCTTSTTALLPKSEDKK